MSWAVMNEQQYNSILPTLPSGVIVGDPVTSQDGRIAINHPFTEEDAAFLGSQGVAVSDTLPSDWQYLTV